MFIDIEDGIMQVKDIGDNWLGGKMNQAIVDEIIINI